MIDLTEETWLQNYAKTNNLNNLSSEDILKLTTEKGYSLEEIAQAYNIKEAEFQKIKQAKGLKNMILEDSIREIDTVLSYLDSQEKYISNKIRSKVVSKLINFLIPDGISNKEFYIKKLTNEDFSREKVMNDIKNKSIDTKHRLKNLNYLKNEINNYVNTLIKQEREYLFNNKTLYNQLTAEKQQGKIFNKKDLTYDILYELAIIENIPDSSIGNIYNMSKTQVRSLRIKEGLNNKFQTQISDHPEMLMYFAENENKGFKDINNYQYDKILHELIGAFPSNSKKNAKKENNKDEITIEINGEAQTYNIQFTDEKYFIPAKKTTRKHKGAIHNYTKENKTKKEHGTIGEQIALEAEKIRLIKMGLEDYVDDVILISKIDEETTFDGLGYDILSYNENLERVCIEVKTTFSTKDRPFYITPKEIEILKGAKEEFDCKHTLMYYLLINDHDVTIKKIKSLDFAQINLETVLYKVKDTEKQEI